MLLRKIFFNTSNGHFRFILTNFSHSYTLEIPNLLHICHNFSPPCYMYWAGVNLQCFCLYIYILQGNLWLKRMDRVHLPKSPCPLIWCFGNILALFANFRLFLAFGDPSTLRSDPYINSPHNSMKCQSERYWEWQTLSA